MGEYANVVTAASMTASLFLGGWLPLFPVSLGSNFVAPALFAFVGALCLYHGLHPAGRMGRYTLPVFALVFFLIAPAMLIPAAVSLFMPVFWFAAKTDCLLFVWILIVDILHA